MKSQIYSIEAVHTTKDGNGSFFKATVGQHFRAAGVTVVEIVKDISHLNNHDETRIVVMAEDSNGKLFEWKEFYKGQGMSITLTNNAL